MADPQPVMAGVKKIKANQDVAGAGLGGLVAWVWNSYALGPEMPPEIAVLIAPIIGRTVRYVLSFLPTADNGHD